jgi:hypothetical protein
MDEPRLMIDRTRADGDKLPVLRTVARGYREAMRHGITYAAQALVWVGVVVAGQYVVGWLAEGSYGPEFNVVAAWLPYVAMLAGAAIIHVAAYRAVILLEIPQWQKALRLGGRELRLFGIHLLFVAVGYLEMALFGIIAQRVGDPHIMSSVLYGSDYVSDVAWNVILSLLLSITLVPFLGLAYPLTAIDTTSGLFRRSYALSRGNRGRIGAIVFLAALPVQIIASAPFSLWDGETDIVLGGLQIAVSSLIYLWGAALRAGALGCAFRFIANQRQERTYDVFD